LKSGAAWFFFFSCVGSERRSSPLNGWCSDGALFFFHSNPKIDGWLFSCFLPFRAFFAVDDVTPWVSLVLAALAVAIWRGELFKTGVRVLVSFFFLTWIFVGEPALSVPCFPALPRRLQVHPHFVSRNIPSLSSSPPARWQPVASRGSSAGPLTRF